MKTIIIQQKLNERYLKEYVPNLFVRIVKSELKKNKKELIFQHLYRNYNISLSDLIQAVDKSWLYITKVGNTTEIKINMNVKVKDVKLNILANFIDLGNLQIKGINFFNNCLNELKRLIKLTYIFYLCSRKGGRT